MAGGGWCGLGGISGAWEGINGVGGDKWDLGGGKVGSGEAK